MSDLDNKLHRDSTTPGTKARATLKQILEQWGECELVVRTSMGVATRWRHSSGRGTEAIFEKLSE